MSRRNRETLRNYFRDGNLPTQRHFTDLIDSMLNMSDEGFNKTPENGIELSTPKTHDAVMSFYRAQSARQALWSVGFGGDDNQLHFQPDSVDAARARPPVLALNNLGRVGINNAAPRQALDVAGVVAAQGRLGTGMALPAASLLADGQWHDICTKLKGCQAFEVVAGVGLPGSGRFALLHAIALNTFNPSAGWLDFFSRKKRIKSQHAYYGRRCDRLQLRWEGSSGDDAEYALRIRTGCNYDNKDVRIRVSLTRLWFDPSMTEPLP